MYLSFNWTEKKISLSYDRNVIPKCIPACLYASMNVIILSTWYVNSVAVAVSDVGALLHEYNDRY